MANLPVDIGDIVQKRERADKLPIAMERQGINMNRRVIDAQELAITTVALRGIGRGCWPKLEEGSKAGRNREGDAVRIVDGDAFQVLALAKNVDPDAPRLAGFKFGRKPGSALGLGKPNQ